MRTHSLTMPDRNPLQALRTLGAWQGGKYPPPPELSLEPHDVRILVVNEDMRSAESLKRTLRDLGYRTTYTAYSGHRAVALADALSPTLALLDLELPDMNGFQLAWRLRNHAHRHVRNMSLFAVSEGESEDEPARARAAGFLGCLTKPVPRFALDQLMRELER